MNHHEPSVLSKQMQNMRLLENYGQTWAILTAWCLDLENKKVVLPPVVEQGLEKLRVEIKSGCYSACDVGCVTTSIVGHLTKASTVFGDAFFEGWMCLYLQAMDGSIDNEKLFAIPALKPVLSSCGFLRCACGG